ncbi:50S ribosomal protein L29 [Sphingobium sp. DEHP117]|uniref:50S ribosomal protein L29 n=1 Tax=Sphingobium sp. DEHP117 TaxID=2993436 RepID=UPI0027D6E337|nr:50S ribosomal protein L29 [Sphingobium sp. DEHP117]MDQ4420267.1 50S ribosomal protein L29 [Sphingobium sp. DEHP117]
MSKIADLRAKSDDELNGELANLKKEQFNLRFQAATNQLEKPARVREVRRSIAKIKTLQNERAASAAGAERARSAAK